MRNEIKDKAIFFWQDRLAKFFPSTLGPTNTEIVMFEAGYELGQKEEAEAKKIIKEAEKLREVLLNVWHEGVCAGKLKDEVKDALWPE